MPYRQVLAAYAAGVALNGFLPANIGTFAMLLMYAAIIPGATFPGVLGGMLVQKIFFSLVGTFVYVYLFASVPGTFERQLELPHDHPVLTVTILAGAAILLVLARARVPAQAARSSSSRPSRAARSSPARASTSCASRCPRSPPGSRSSRSSPSSSRATGSPSRSTP